MHEYRRRIMPLRHLLDHDRGGRPDLKGWDVVEASGRKIGEVDALLYDTLARKVRYLKVRMGAGGPTSRGARRILVPVGYARARPRERRVVVAGTRSDLSRVPRNSGLVTWRDEVEVLRALDPAFDPDRGGRIYESPAFDETRLFGG